MIGQLADYVAHARMDGRAKRRMEPASLKTGAAQQDDAQADPLRHYLRQTIRDDYLVMNAARLSSALTTDSPFVERLVHFWANHFAVSADKLPVIGLAGLLEFEAIRPHVFGRFSRHAVRGRAASGDAALSRPGAVDRSRFARSAVRRALRGGKQRGLNENLAREILELHTLGVRTGYSQADVTEFARALTGWTVGGIARGPVRACIGGGGRLAVSSSPSAARAGRRARSSASAMREQGEAQARAMLRDLAASPRDGQAHRHQARAAFRRRRSAAGDRRSADRRLSRERAATCRPSIAP